MKQRLTILMFLLCSACDVALEISGDESAAPIEAPVSAASEIAGVTESTFGVWASGGASPKFTITSMFFNSSSTTGRTGE